MNCLLITLCFVATIAAVSGTDYCKLPCYNFGTKKNVTNVGCRDSDTFADSCPSDAKTLPITASVEAAIVHQHNVKRNFIAGGGDPNHDPASYMATMKYDHKLAELADFNAMQCKTEHDDCHRTPEFEYAGQNIWSMTQSPPPTGDVNVNEVFINAINSWYSEVKDSNRRYIKSYPQNRPPKPIGHFTVMMSDRSYAVGCGGATYTEAGSKHTTVVCNYASTNIIGHKIYAAAKKAAEACKTGPNRKYPNLCSPNEKYDVNKIF